MKETILDRFLRYVKIDTQSQDEAEAYPSTAKQFDLLNPLVKELQELGLKLIATVPYDANLVAADLKGVPAYTLSADSPAMSAMRSVIDSLEQIR